MKKAHLLIFFLFIYCPAFSHTIDVNLFHEYEVGTVVVTPVRGVFSVIMDYTYCYDLKKGNILYISLFDDSLMIMDLHDFSRKCSFLDLKAGEDNCALRVKPVFPEAGSRSYEGDLIFKATDRDVQIINRVDIEKYIAAVVESEAGRNSSLEFYKSQAVICRTYAIKYMNKHQSEGFNLCDDVHCQVYKGRCLLQDIDEASRLTKELIIADTSGVPIIAAFHSNSGGETANSEDVWLQAQYYLKSVQDPYSLNQKNSTWEQVIPYDQWISYLNKKGFGLNENADPNLFKFKQNHRKNTYSIQGKSLPLKMIRSDWNLKSTFFSISVKGKQLVFSGKGYGHGVGLSQEGAMNMAGKGFTYKEIIAFYFKGAEIINYQEALPEGDMKNNEGFR